MTQSQREVFLDAAVASYAAMWPDRLVQRGVELDPTRKDAKLRQGLVCFVGGRLSGWAEYTGREGEYGTLEFAVVMWGKLDGSDQSTEHVERLEAQFEAELLQWCRSIKQGPLLDAVYPREVVPSSGMDAPLAWIVARLEGLYV